MSLLLDALKKSEAQRQRGQVPTLTPGAPGGGDAGFVSRARRGRWVSVLVVLLVVVVTAAYFLLPSRLGLESRPEADAPALAATSETEAPAEGSGAAGPVDSGSPSSDSQPPAPDATPPDTAPAAVADDREQDQTGAAASDPEPVVVADSSPEQAAASEPQTPRDAASKRAAAETTAAAIPPEVQQARDRAALAARVAQQARDGTVRPRAPRRGPTPAAPSRDETSASAPRVADEPAPLAGNESEQARADGAIRPWELPEAMRAEFPNLDLTVHFYASNPRDRFVIINGERFGEGGRPASSVRIGEIRDRGVVVDFRNYRVLIE